jgi:hypothetical protein
VFLLNSCLGLFSAACFRRHPLSLTYGVNLPSSLTTLLPIALGFSPHPPVSVYGTSTSTLDSGFSRQCGTIHFATLISLPVSPSEHRAYFTAQLPIYLGPAIPAAGTDYPPASPHLSNMCRQYRNINLLSITYAFRPRLRSRLTLGGRTFPRKPWIFGGKDSHFTLATHSGILTRMMSTCPYDHASTLIRSSSTT